MFVFALAIKVKLPASAVPASYYCAIPVPYIEQLVQGNLNIILAGVLLKTPVSGQGFLAAMLVYK